MERDRRDEGGRHLPTGFASRIAADLRTLPRQFWLLAAGSFVYLVGVEMCYPFETLFMDRVLGLSTTAIGVIIGVSLFATLPFQVLGGALCDRVGRKPVLVVSIVGSTTLYIGFGLTRDLAVVVALIVFEAAFGWAQFLTATNAIIADLSPPARRAEAFSVFRAAVNAGITVGPLLAAPLLVRDPSFRLSFLTGGAIACSFLVFVIVFFRETRPEGAAAASAPLRGYGRVVRDRRLILFCVVALLPLYCFGQIWVTLPIMLSELHGIAPQQWGLALVVYGAATALLQYPLVRALRHVDHLVLLGVSSAALALGLGVAAFVPWPWTIACTLAISLSVVLLVPISSTVVARLAPPELRGRYMGLWTLVYIGGYALGPLLGGWAMDALGGRGASLVAVGVGTLGAVLFVALRRRIEPRAAAGA